MHKLISAAIADFRAGGSGELPEGVLDENSDLYPLLQEKAVDFIFVIDESILPFPKSGEVEDHFSPEDYDGRDKILNLMTQRASQATDECPTVNHWSEGGLFITVCMDFEGHSPVFSNFKVYSNKSECIGQYKRWGQVAYVDDRIVSHSASELLSLFNKRLGVSR